MLLIYEHSCLYFLIQTALLSLTIYADIEILNLKNISYFLFLLLEVLKKYFAFATFTDAFLHRQEFTWIEYHI